MKKLTTGLLVAAATWTAVRAASSTQEVEIHQKAPSEEHAWLLPMVGEWEASWDMESGSTGGATAWKSHESITSLAMGDDGEWVQYMQVNFTRAK